MAAGGRTSLLPFYYSVLEMDSHDIQLVKHLAAVGTFPHAVVDAVVNTVAAEDVTTSLDCGVLEVVVAHGTGGKFLARVSEARVEQLWT